jgi:hypothetical protein
MSWRLMAGLVPVAAGVVPVVRWIRKRRHPSTASPEETHALLVEAIRRKEQVLGYHKERQIVFCPHVLATGPGGDYVLAFVIIAEPDPGADFVSPKRWRWLRLTDLRVTARRSGLWFSAPRESRPLLSSVIVQLEAA